MKFFSLLAAAALTCACWVHAEIPAGQGSSAETRIGAAAIVAKKDVRHIAENAQIENGDLIWAADGVELELSLVNFQTPNALRVNGSPIALPEHGLGRLLLATVQAHVIPEGQLRARIYLAARNLVDPGSRTAIGEALFSGFHPEGRSGGILAWNGPSEHPTMMPIDDPVGAFLKCVEGCVKAGGDSKACPEACAKVVTGN